MVASQKTGAETPNSAKPIAARSASDSLRAHPAMSSSCGDDDASRPAGGGEPVDERRHSMIRRVFVWAVIALLVFMLVATLLLDTAA